MWGGLEFALDIFDILRFFAALLIDDNVKADAFPFCRQGGFVVEGGNMGKNLFGGIIISDVAEIQ